MEALLGHSGGTTFRTTQSSTRVASQPSRSLQRKHVRGAVSDADSESSEDPLLLTDRSSQPGSPVKSHKLRQSRSDEYDIPRAKENRRDTSKPRPTASKVAQAEHDPPKKRARAPPNPFSAGLTNTAAQPQPRKEAMKGKPPARSASTAKRTTSRSYVEEDNDVDDTPKASKSRNPLLNRDNASSSSQSQSQPKTKQFPMQDLRTKQRAARPPSPEPSKPAPFPLLNMVPVKSKAPPEGSKPAPFPLEHLAKSKTTEPQGPAPFPLAAAVTAKKATSAAAAEPAPFPLAHLKPSLSTTSATPLVDDSTTGKRLADRAAPKKPAATASGPAAQTNKRKQKTLTDHMFMPKTLGTPQNAKLADTSIDTPSPIRPEMLRTVKQPFPLPPPTSSVHSSSSSSGPSSSSEPALRPFPLAGAARKPTRLSPKRPNEDASDSDRSSKRRKCSEDGDDDDSMDADMTMSPISPEPALNMDPSLLCPFCDELLPENRSSVFDDLLANALKQAYPKWRRANPLGKRAPMTAYISVCERHRFEAKILPQAIRAGWPTKIDFNALPGRIQKKKIRQLLEGVLADPTSSSFFMEAMENVVKVGARVAESAMGQYAVFEKIQPGYYGERGSVVLHQALFALFPPRVLAAAQPRFAPLSAQTFLHSVLVPETALALVMEDMPAASRAEALKTLRASSRYGSLMFPDDDEEDGAGEAMMRERARQRRKEIEREEAEERRQEQEEKDTATAKAQEQRIALQPMEVESDASQVSAKPRRTAKGKGKARAEDTGAASTTSTKRAKAKAPPTVADVDDDEPMSTTLTTPRRTAKKSKKRANGADADAEEDDGAVSTSTATSRAPRSAKARALATTSYVEVDTDDDDGQKTVKKPRARKVTQRPPIDLTSDADASGESSSRKKSNQRSKVAIDTEEHSSDARPARSLANNSRSAKKSMDEPIDMTSDAESVGRPSTRASSRRPLDVHAVGATASASNKRTNSVATQSRRSASNDSEDDIQPDVWQSLMHTEPSSQQSASASCARTSSQQLRKAPLRDRNQVTRPRKLDPLGLDASDDDDRAASAPLQRREHTRWDENGEVHSSLQVLDNKTPRASSESRRTNSAADKPLSPFKDAPKASSYHPTSQDQWLLSSPSQRSDDTDLMLACIEQMENDP